MRTSTSLVICGLLMLPSCTGEGPKENSSNNGFAAVQTDTPGIAITPPANIKKRVDTATLVTPDKSTVSAPKTYSNKRFRDVSVQKAGDNMFLVTGKAQVFEAAFSWVAEDGHEELQTGHEMTDAGAPAWGKFRFTVEVIKKRENSTAHVVLFEASAKDGSRQHELRVPLY